MSLAQPKIDQATKPAGVVGESRDDLDLWSGANPITLTDLGGGSPVWQLVDKPEGSNAVLATPNNPVCLLNNADVDGSYLIQLTVDGGGLPGQIVQLIVGIQLGLPTWITPPEGQKLRIPAFGETTQFNVKSSPGSGVNNRGWAYEMEQWFRSISAFGFGVEIKNAGAAFGAGPFYTLNLTGATLTDAGNGQVDIAVAGGGGGISSVKNDGVALAGAPWTILDSRKPALPFPLALLTEQDIQFIDQGAGSVGVIGTGAHHKRHHHSSGVDVDVQPSSPAATPLYPTLNNLNPTPWSFAPILAGQYLVSNGRTLTSADIPAPLGLSLVGVVWALYDLVLNATGAGPTVAVQALAVNLAPTLDIAITDIDPITPPGGVSLAVGNVPNPILSYNGGPPILITLPGTYRLVDLDGRWVEVFINTVPLVNSTDIWTIQPSFALTERRFRIARAVWWDQGGGGMVWGVGTSFRFLDLRQFGSVGAKDVQDDVKAMMDRIGGDTRLLNGVVFDRRMNPHLNLEPMAGGFELVQLVGGPTYPYVAGGILGGDVWCNGRRFTARRGRNFATMMSGSTLASVLVFASVNLATGFCDIDYIETGDPVAGIQSLLAKINGANGQTAADGQFGIPLYFGVTDGAGNLTPEGRIDLRRDVAHIGEWTVGSRSLQEILLDPDGILPPAPVPMAGINEQPTLAEFDSICAALAWHTALESPDAPVPGTTNFYIGGSAADNAPLHIRVIRSTLETYPFVLWANVTIEGKGQPRVFMEYQAATSGWFYIGLSPNGVGAPSNRIARNVRVSGFDLIARNVPNVLAAKLGGILRLVAPEIDLADPLFATKIPTHSLLNVQVEDIGISTLDRAVITDTDLFAGVLLFNPNVGGFARGSMADVLLNRVRVIPSFHLAAQSYALSPMNAGIVVTTDASGLEPSRGLTITGGRLTPRIGGISVAHFLQVNIRENYVNIDNQLAAGATGISIEQVSGRVTNNDVKLLNDTSQIGIFSQDNSKLLVADNRFVLLGAPQGGVGISVFSFNDVVQENVYAHNEVSGGWTGFQHLNVASKIEVTDNRFTASPLDTGAEAVGINLPLSDSRGWKITNNIVDGYRTGIVLNGDNDVTDFRIEDNDIRMDAGALDGTLSLVNGFGRGIVIGLNPNPDLDRGIVVRRNRITGFAVIPNSDTNYYPGVGAMAAGITLTGWIGSGPGNSRGLVVSDNLIRAYEPGELLSHRVNGNLAGIAVFGGWSELTVENNEIQNILGAVEQDTAGIWFDGFGSSIVSTSTRKLRGNVIGWVSACNKTTAIPDAAQPEAKQFAAGIMIIGQQNLLEVTENLIAVQSVPDGASLVGYIHGIMLKSATGLPVDGIGISRNRIYTPSVGVDGAYKPGAIGAGINVHAPNSGSGLRLQNITVMQNVVGGNFQHATDPASYALDAEGWGGICISHMGAEGGKRIVVTDNVVNLEDFGGGGYGGPSLFFGIRVGSLTQPGGLGNRAITDLTVCSNSVQIDGDTSVSGPSWAACIMLASQDAASGRVDSTEAIVNDNKLSRTDPGLSIRGIVNHGFGQSLFANNSITGDGPSGLQDDNVGGAMVAQNIWTGNRFGTAALPGVSLLTAPPYQITGAGTNWTGTAFV